MYLWVYSDHFVLRTSITTKTYVTLIQKYVLKIKKMTWDHIKSLESHINFHPIYGRLENLVNLDHIQALRNLMYSYVTFSDTTIFHIFSGRYSLQCRDVYQKYWK